MTHVTYGFSKRDCASLLCEEQGGFKTKNKSNKTI